MKTSLTVTEVTELLATIYDPEMGLNIVDLGLVYRLEVTPEAIDLRLLFTAQACPLRQLIVQWCDELLTAHATQAVRLSVEEETSWTPERLSPDGREALGYRR